MTVLLKEAIPRRRIATYVLAVTLHAVPAPDPRRPSAQLVIQVAEPPGSTAPQAPAQRHVLMVPTGQIILITIVLCVTLAVKPVLAHLQSAVIPVILLQWTISTFILTGVSMPVRLIFLQTMFYQNAFLVTLHVVSVMRRAKPLALNATATQLPPYLVHLKNRAIVHAQTVPICLRKRVWSVILLV